MVNEFKLTVVHCVRVDLPLDKKLENQDWATGLLGRRAAGPSRAVGRGPMGLRAAGPLGRRGPWAAGRWAAGLLLAKPGGTVVPRESDANLEGNSNSIC